MPKNTHGTRSDLVHCDNCDEDYSATYKRCPFCGARPDRSAYTQATSRFIPVDRPSSDRRASGDERTRRSAPQSDDEYVFDGSGVFDDDDRDDDDRDDSGYVARRGGKRLADDGFILSPTTIAGIIFSLVVIIAAILIVVKVVLPMVRQGDQPVQTNSPNTSLPNTSQSPAPSTPGPGVTDDPIPSDSPSPTNDITVSPSPSAPVSDGQPTSFILVYGRETKPKTEFTISSANPSPVQLHAKFTPSDTTSTVTWSSSNTNVATVSSKGLVTGVGKGTATITATLDNGLTQTCTVYVTLSGTATASPSPSASTSPSPSSSSSGTLTLNKTDITISNDWPDPIRLQVSGASGDVTWSSSNTAVATVDANGKVTRVGKGQCKVTATDASGQTASCIVRCGSMGS